MVRADLEDALHVRLGDPPWHRCRCFRGAHGDQPRGFGDVDASCHLVAQRAYPGAGGRALPEPFGVRLLQLVLAHPPGLWALPVGSLEGPVLLGHEVRCMGAGRNQKGQNALVAVGVEGHLNGGNAEDRRLQVPGDLECTRRTVSSEVSTLVILWAAPLFASSSATPYTMRPPPLLAMAAMGFAILARPVSPAAVVGISLFHSRVAVSRIPASTARTHGSDVKGSPVVIPNAA